ncbi:heparinase II/III family protein [Cohnella suwonensis]|uniref:Heparinase II/III family protein n=1 Tax=Cohnella suwonensis TaxID=696072 RepID=A0ABW0LY38_9BACL
MNRESVSSLLEKLTDDKPDLLRGGMPDASVARTIGKEAVEAAERYLGAEAPVLDEGLFRLFRETGSRSEYERPYFLRRKRLTAFGIAGLLEPARDDFPAALAKTIEDVLEEPTWCLPAHYENERTIDLFAAETAFALAELLSLYGSRLPLGLRDIANGEIRRRVLAPFLHDGPYFWETAQHNWASVCAGSIGAAALYATEDRNDLALTISKALDAMDCFLSGYGMDGACSEGYGYWQYGFGYFSYFGELLAQRTKGRIDLFRSAKVHQMALFQQRIFMGDRSVANFSDSRRESGVHPGLTSLLRSKFDDVHVPDESQRVSLEDDHCGRWAPAIRDLLWTAADGVSGSAWPDGSSYMSDVDWLVSRTVSGGETFSFAAKGGHNDEPHNHNDVGHFLLSRNGLPLLLDLGSGQYTRDYFGSRRYETLCNRSRGHSVPIVNGLEQATGRAAGATVGLAATGERFDVLELDLTRAYPVPELKRLGRTFRWAKKEGRLELEDAYAFASRPLEVVERFIVPSKPQELELGMIGIAGCEGGGGRGLRVAYDPSQLVWQAEELTHVDHFGVPVVCYALDFLPLELRETMRFRFSFYLNEMG